jgi:hypothetical protein
MRPGAFFSLALALVLLSTASQAAGACDPANDRVRIGAHLARVEVQLRRRDVSDLTARQRAARLRNIERLRAYRERGVYPRNEDFPGELVPYFVDDRGVHCAVAGLVAESGEEALVERVVALHNNARVREMQIPALATWAEQQGLTVDELALIQPSYCGGGCMGSGLCSGSYCASNGPGTGSCSTWLEPNGTPCSTQDNPDACVEQVCRGGQCVSDGRELDCDDGDPNTTDYCDPIDGCANEPNQSCTIGNAAGGWGALPSLLLGMLMLARRYQPRRRR